MGWTQADNQKLLSLFRKPPSKGGIDTEDLSVKAVQAIHKKHWPGEEYKNFAPLFRRKARSWNVNKTLTGGCRKLMLLLFLACHMQCLLLIFLLV